MNEENLEKIMTANYSRVFKDMLLAAFKSDPKLTPSYLSEPIQRQRKIESEIEKQSNEMAKLLVGRLKEKGYLTKEPSDKELKDLIRETLHKFGVSK